MKKGMLVLFVLLLTACKSTEEKYEVVKPVMVDGPIQDMPKPGEVDKVKVIEEKPVKEGAPKPADTTPSEPAGAYEPVGEKYKLNGRGFTVDQSGNEVTVSALNNTSAKNVMVSEISGVIDDVKIADLNGNGLPEIYIIERAADGTTEVIAYSATAGQTIVPIQMVDHFNITKGYGGNDEFVVEGNRLKRTFPIYTEEEPRVDTGQKRVVHYQLKKGTVGGILFPASAGDV